MSWLTVETEARDWIREICLLNFQQTFH